MRVICWAALLMVIGSMVATQPVVAQSNSPCGGLSSGAFVNWPQFHANPCHTGYNPNEFILSAATVPNLVLDWQVHVLGSSPVVANGIAYIGAGDGLYAFNARTGALLWKYTTATGAGVPAVSDGVVCFDSYRSIYALNAATGEFIWRYQIATFGSAYSVTVAGNMVYFGTTDHNIFALSAKTGALVWNFTTSGQPDYSLFSLAVADRAVYVGSGDFASYLYALDADTGALRWKYSTKTSLLPIWPLPSPAVSNGVVYAGSGNGFVYAVSTENGTLVWRSRACHSTYGIEGEPAVANGAVYVGCDDGAIYAFNAANGELLWRYQANASLLRASPSVANGVVYFEADQDRFYAVAADSGKLLWSYYTGQYNDVAPAVVNGMVYFASKVDAFRGYLYAFHLPNQEETTKVDFR